MLDPNIGTPGNTTIQPKEIRRAWDEGIYDPVHRDIPLILRHRIPPINNKRLQKMVLRFGKGKSGLALTTIPARPYSYNQNLIMNSYAYSMQFSNRLLGTITIPGAPNLAPIDGVAPVICPFGCDHADMNGGKHAFTCKKLGRHVQCHSLVEDAVALMIADALAIPIKQGSATVVLADEKRHDARNNLRTTIPITPHVHKDDAPNTNGRTFGDILVVQNTSLPTTKFPTNRDCFIADNTPARAITARYTNMSTLWNEALETFLEHLTDGTSAGASYFFVDVHISAGTSSNIESTSRSKLVQYAKAWNQFRTETLPSNPDKYQHLMTRYEQINHSRNGQPNVHIFGINYDGYLDSHARNFMFDLACIKYPTDPNNRSYKPSRARWISHYARQIQLAIANGAAPAISYTMRNLTSDLSRIALPPDLDPCIPAFQLNNTVLSERHPDSSAYESLNATGKIVVQATPAYHLEASESADLPYCERIDILSNGGSDNDTLVRSETDETRVFDVISNLFPEAHACDTGIKTFYLQVKEKVEENFGVILNDDLWIPFVWDAVYTLMHADQEGQNMENEVFSEESQSFSGNMPLSQIQTSGGSQIRTSGGSQSFSDKFKISSCCPNVSMPSSIDINSIAMSHNPNGPTQNQCQSLSVPLAQQSVYGTYLSADLDTPRDIIDDISSTLTHTSNQDMHNVDNSSETSESQSIDINSIKINNYVHNDCESLQIDIDEIETRGRENGREMVGERDRDMEQGNNKSGREKEKKMDGGNEIGREIERERERGNGKNGREKRRKKERKSKMKKKKYERKSDSILMDDDKDSIALRMKRNDRRINHQSDGDDDDNTSYEY